MPDPEFVVSDAYRGLIDLWKQVYSVGTEAHQLALFSEYNWNFSNLRDAFLEGGVLHGTTVYLFSSTEDKIVITSPQRDSEEILDMQEMNMDWVPWVSAVERLESHIFLLSRVQRCAGLLTRVNECEYWIPYFNHPFKVVCEFDWEMDELEEFTNEHLPVEESSESQKDTFKQFVKERVREGKRANHETRKKRMNALEEPRQQEEIAAFKKMRFYKFYPVATTDTPDISHLKVRVINMYYGHAHQVL